MRRTKSIFSLNLSTISPYLPFIIFSTVFALGVLIGNIAVGRFDVLITYSSETITDFILARNEFNFYTAFKSSAFAVFPMYVIIFLCGTSVVGCVASPIALLYKGFGYGCLSGYLYFTYKLEGIMFNALLLIPSTLTTAFGLVLLAKESFAFSYLLSGICIKSNRPVNVYSNFKMYCTRSLVTVIAALVAVVFDLGMSALFINFFNF